MFDFETDIILRDARPDDASFIARAVWAGMDMLDLGETIPDKQMPMYEYFTGICRRDDTLYSYLRTRIAECDGETVGALVSYDGGEYAQLRERTFGLFENATGRKISHNAMESQAGEYYLDSMAVMPDFRGAGIGKMLMRDRMNWASRSGISTATLLVDKEKPRLQQYYESLGFIFKEEVLFFGSWYNKLKCAL